MEHVDEIIRGEVPMPDSRPSPEFLATIAASVRSGHFNQTSGKSCQSCSTGSSASSHCRHDGRAAPKKDSREAHLARDDSWSAFGQRVGGPVVVLGCYMIIGFVAHAYFMVAMPWFELGPLMSFTMSAPAAVLCFRLCYDYARAALASPGPPEGPRMMTDSAPKQEQRWCHTCNVAKPLRCHHCKVCRRCVTRMDHHCLYIANCVGSHNMRRFILALFEAVVGLCVTTCWMFPVLIEVFCINPESRYGKASFWRRFHILLAFLTSAVSLYYMAQILWNMMEVIFNNETTIEGLGNSTHKRARPYFRGYYENFREHLGEPPLWCRERAKRAIEVLGHIMDDNELRL